MLFAVPKSVGTAVKRNRARRRVREALRELARDEAVVLAGGEYRIGIFAPLEEVSPARLRATVGRLMTEVQR